MTCTSIRVVSSNTIERAAKQAPWLVPPEEIEFYPWRKVQPRRRDDGLIDEILTQFGDDEVLDLIDPPESEAEP